MTRQPDDGPFDPMSVEAVEREQRKGDPQEGQKDGMKPSGEAAQGPKGNWDNELNKPIPDYWVVGDPSGF